MSCLEFLYSGAVLHYKPQVYCEQWKVCVWKGKSEKMKNKWLSARVRESVCGGLGGRVRDWTLHNLMMSMTHELPMKLNYQWVSPINITAECTDL